MLRILKTKINFYRPYLRKTLISVNLSNLIKSLLQSILFTTAVITTENLLQHHFDLQGMALLLKICFLYNSKFSLTSKYLLWLLNGPLFYNNHQLHPQKITIKNPNIGTDRSEKPMQTQLWAQGPVVQN